MLFRPNLRRFHTNERHICLGAALHLFCEKTIMDQLPPRLLFRYSPNKPLGTTDVGGCAMCNVFVIIIIHLGRLQKLWNVPLSLVWWVADGRSFQKICNMLAEFKEVFFPSGTRFWVKRKQQPGSLVPTFSIYDYYPNDD